MIGRDTFLLCFPFQSISLIGVPFPFHCRSTSALVVSRHPRCDEGSLAVYTRFQIPLASSTTMYKRLATAALAGIASAAVASSAPYPSVSICTETSTLIYRSTTAYSTYYVTHTLGEGGYPAASGSAPIYGTGSSSAAPQPTGGYGSSSSGVEGPTGSYPPEVTITDVTTVYTTTCPAESTYTSGSETLTSTYTTVSTLTSTYQSTVTLPGGYGSSSEATPSSYPASSLPASPETQSAPVSYTSICTETSTLIYQSTTVYSTYVVTHTTYPSSPETTVTDVTTVYTTTCPASSIYTSDSSEMTSYYTATSTLTSTYQSTITAYPSPSASSPASPETTAEGPPAPYTSPAASSPVSPGTGSEVPPAPYSTPAASSPAFPETTTEAVPAPPPYSGASSWTTEAGSEAGGIGSYIMSPGPYSSPASPVTTSLPPVVPYPVPSGNATYPAISTGLPSASSSGYPVEQTGNAGVAVKPLGTLVGLAGLAAALF